MAKSFQVDTGGTLTTGLVSYYKCYDTTDFYGSNNLTNTGAAFSVSGRVNNGVDFGNTAGNGNRLSIANGLGVDLSSNASISMWIYPTNGAGVNESQFLDWRSTTGTARYMILFINAGGTELRGDMSGTSFATGTNVTLNAWNHIVVTYAAGGTVTYYLNGTSLGTVSRGTATSTNVMAIGNSSSTSRGLSGKADEVGFWNKVLSAQEISDLYNSGNGQTMNPPIEFDNATDAPFVTSTSLTYSHTCGTGSNRLLFVGVFGDTTNDLITGVTYNGVAMTLIDKVSGATTGDRWTYAYYLINPATGANNVVVSASSSTVIGSEAASYYGTNQSGQPDAFTKVTQASNVTSQVTTLTTIADNCWTVIYAKGNVVAAGTNTKLRIGESVGRTLIGDSGGPISPAGSFSMTITQSSAPMATVMASFAPFVAAPATTNSNMLMFC